MIRLVCASANPDKVAEIAALLDGVAELSPRPEGLADVVEDGATLEDNARLKAAAVCAAAGAPAVADDTGLFVDALGGRPGVHAGRYAGEGAGYAKNRARVLDELDGVVDRRARFVTVALVAWPDGRELAVEGVCAGVIAAQERGGRGFGYDSLFVPVEGDGRTFAEMSEQEKNDISHRAKAFAALAARLRAEQ
jgi:XTP/dITP diphosphohydrolase